MATGGIPQPARIYLGQLQNVDDDLAQVGDTIVVASIDGNGIPQYESGPGGGGGGPPSGPAGGVLSGAYPNPGFAVDMATQAELNALAAIAVLDGDAAGGDITGTYPSPTLVAIGVATGPIGSASTVPVVTIDAKGRVTALGSAAITGTPPGGAAGGVLSGTYPNPGFAVDMATQAELDAAVAALTAADAAVLAAAVIKAPGSNTRNLVQPTGNFTGLTLKTHATQTQPQFLLVDESDVTQGQWTADGNLVLGATAPNGAAFQVDRAYTDPVDEFKAIDIDVTFTATQDNEDHWRGYAATITLQGDGGSPAAGALSTFAGFSAIVINDMQPVDPDAYNVYDTSGFQGYVETTPQQRGYAGTMTGGYFAAFHQGTGEGYPTAVWGLPILKGSPTVNNAPPNTYMVSFYASIENASDKEVGMAAMFEASVPYNNGPAGSRWTELHGLLVRNVGGSIASAGKTKTSYAIRIEAQSGGTVASYAIVSEGGASLLKSGSATVSPLTLRGFAAQTGALQVWQSVTPVDLLAVLSGGALEMLEQSDPAAPAANKLRLYSRDSGGGLTQLVARFPSGNTVVVAEDF